MITHPGLYFHRNEVLHRCCTVYSMFHGLYDDRRVNFVVYTGLLCLRNKRATLFSTITLVFLGRLLKQLCTIGNRNEHFIIIYNLLTGRLDDVINVTYRKFTSYNCMLKLNVQF